MRPRPLLLTACALLLAASAPAWAGYEADLRKANEALFAWDMGRAKAAVRRLIAARPAEGATLLAQGRLELLSGRYAEASAALERAVAAGAGPTALHFLEIAKATRDTTKGYLRHKTADGHFEISHAPGVDAVLVPYAEAALEASWQHLTQLFQFSPPTPIRVEIYPRVEALGAVSSLTVDEIKTSGTIALCKYNRLMIVSPRELVYGYGWQDTLAHEFIHLLVTQKSHNTVPVWLHEGLAKFYDHRWRGVSRSPLSRHSEDLLARALKDEELIPFGAMSPSMAKLPSQHATATAFAEVYTVIEFLVERSGDLIAAQLPQLLRSGKTDQDTVAALAELPWTKFEGAWKGFLRQRGLRTLKQPFAERMLFRGDATEEDELALLEADKARDFTWLGDQLRMKGRFRAATKEYAKAAEVAGDASPIIQSKLGYALLRQGEVDRAIEALTKPLALADDYVLLHLYLGEAYLSKGELEQAREHLEHAIGLNPFDPQVHERLAMVYERLGKTDAAARERRAHQLVTSG